MFCDSLLNQPSNKLIFATSGMLSSSGARDLVRDCRENDASYYAHYNDFDVVEIYCRDWMSDEKANLGTKILNAHVLVACEVGRWDGRVYGAKTLSYYRLSDILNWNFGCDEYALYYDRYNVHFFGRHHDGVNRGVIREIKGDYDPSEIAYRYVNNADKSAVLSKYTKSLTPYLKQIYGA